ncbi:hypothetical protein JW935_26975 [candidate division KSB1 bacterium]|nr:hypothetical protein [candidate division KSB1 bacterium]
MGEATTLFNYYNYGRNVIKARYAGSWGRSVWILGGYPGYNYDANVIEHSYRANIENQGQLLNATNNCWGGVPSNIGPVETNPGYPTCPPTPIGPSWPLQKSSQDVLAQAWWAYVDEEYLKAEELAEQAFDENRTGNRAGEALFLLMKIADQLGMLA